MSKKKTFKIVHKEFDAGVRSQCAHNGCIQHVFLHKKTIINISRLTIIKKKNICVKCERS